MTTQDLYDILPLEQCFHNIVGSVYWRPVFNLLEADHAIILVNAQHMKAVLGRKTDVKDSEWLADLLRHGLLKASFIPPQPIRALRELTRYRKTLVQERAQEVNRLHKVLESANLTLGAVATDVLGASGRDMLRHALEGRLSDQHRVLIRHVLAHIDFLEAQLAQLTGEIETVSASCTEAVALLVTIPGVAETAATAMIAEIGVDMSRFPTAKHLASWAGVCPGNRQSGGKRLSGKTTDGNPWLRAVLGEVAWSISHTVGTYLAALYHRLARRCGKHKAVVAVAHSVLVSIYHMLRDHEPYHDLGPDHFDRLDTMRMQRHYIHRLEQLGFAVTLTPAGTA